MARGTRGGAAAAGWARGGLRAGDQTWARVPGVGLSVRIVFFFFFFKRSIWGSSPDPYDSAGADGDLSIINHGYSDTSRHLIEKGLVIHRFRPERDFGRDLSTRVPSHVPHAVTCGRVHSDRTIASLAWERCISRRKKRWTRGLVDSLGQFENRTEYIGQFQACCE